VVDLVSSAGVYRRLWTPGVDRRKMLKIDIINDRHYRLRQGVLYNSRTPWLRVLWAARSTIARFQSR